MARRSPRSLVAAGLALALAVLGGASLAAGAPAAAAAGATPPRVDLNAASLQELTSLPGIGPAKAEAIVAHRSKTPFTKVEDLRAVPGIGDRMLERLADQVTVGAPGANAGAAAGGAPGAAPAGSAGRTASGANPASVHP